MLVIVKPKSLLLLAGLVSLTVMSTAEAGEADCTSSGTPTLPSGQNLTIDIPRDLQVGGAITTSRIPINWIFSCKSTGITKAAAWAIDMAKQAGFTAVSDLPNVYTTPFMPAGIGFRILDASNKPIAFGTVDNMTRAFRLGDAPVGQTNFTWSGAVELVKTSTTPVAGTFQLQFTPRVSFLQALANGTLDNSTFSPTWTINKPALTTCTVTNPTQSITLPTVSANAINSSASGNTPFTISLNCQAGTTLYMTMSDANNPSNRSQLLGPPGTTGTPQYGLTIMYRDPVTGVAPSRVIFGQDLSTAGTSGQFKIGATPNGVMNINFYAAYNRLTGAPTPFPVGPFSAKATFTLSYQ